MKTLRYVICDVFTERPLSGNPLAVFTDARGIGAHTMQALARELNLSETVFVLPPDQGGQARIRIFTPARELPFAGHPVLGTAFVLGAAMSCAEVGLETGRGLMAVRLEREGARVTFGWMRQPTPTVESFAEPAALLQALGVRDAELPILVYDNGVAHALVELESEQAVSALKPQLEGLARLPAVGFLAFAGSSARYRARLFAPRAGIPEDPATGSAAGPLALHLARHGLIGFGETLRIEQGIELSRPSLLHARVLGSAARVTAIEVGGSAVIVARGEFRWP